MGYLQTAYVNGVIRSIVLSQMNTAMIFLQVVFFIRNKNK